MRESATALSSPWFAWAGVLASLGGLLWVPYGVFEMLEPWGADTVFSEDRGYSVIADSSNFLIYSFPGGLGLLLISLGLLGVLARLQLPATPITRIARILAVVSVVLAVGTVIGVMVQLDPLFTTGRVFGSLAQGIATVFAGLGAFRVGVARGWSRTLTILGVMGTGLLPLWPLVYAVKWVPETVGAGYMALFGLGWMIVGYQLSTDGVGSGPPAPQATTR